MSYLHGTSVLEKSELELEWYAKLLKLRRSAPPATPKLEARCYRRDIEHIQVLQQMPSSWS